MNLAPRERGFCLPCAVLIGFAVSTSAAAQTERFYETRGGEPVVVGLHPSVKDDCSRGPLVEIALGEAPRNGLISIQGGRIAVEGVGNCPPIEATANRVVYRPSLTFSGEDHFSYRTTDYLGRVKLHVIRITVRPRARARSDDRT